MRTNKQSACRSSHRKAGAFQNVSKLSDAEAHCRPWPGTTLSRLEDLVDERLFRSQINREPGALGECRFRSPMPSGSHRFRIDFAFGELSKQGVDPFFLHKT